MGIDESHVIHVESPGKAGKKGADHQGEALVAEGADAHGLRRILVFSYGDKIVAPFGINHPVDGIDAGGGKEESQIVIGNLAAKRLDDQNSLHPFGQVSPDGGDHTEDFSYGNGCQGKIGPAQAETDPADDEPTSSATGPPSNIPHQAEIPSLVTHRPAV